MRERDDLLASAAGLAGRRGLGGPASGAAGPPRRSRSARLEPRQHRQLDRPGEGAEKGGPATEAVGPNPTDRGKPGTKHHLVTERQGIPLVSLQTAANVNEGTVLLDAVDAIPPAKRPRGRPRRRPAKLHADKAYAGRARRAALRRRHITPRVARPGIDPKTKLGRHRWVVERAFAWLHRNRRLLVRYERRDDLHDAFLHLGSALICWAFCSDDFC
jgi:transposase